MLNSKSWQTPAAIAVVGMIAAILVAMNYPAVEGLGNKVRLPVFHGAMTWANLVAFAMLAASAVMYLFKGSDGWWARTSGYRYVTIGMWLAGSVLGFMAALSAWDFTASKTPAMELMLDDPRLLIQVIISLMGIALLVLPLVTESRRVRAVFDIIFVGALWVSLGIATQSERGLHPDSPVMNSDELIIKLLFFMMVAAQLVFAFGAGTAASNFVLARLGQASTRPAESE